jgi:glycosyltransferase involved in cell wall biosynthesis
MKAVILVTHFTSGRNGRAEAAGGGRPRMVRDLARYFVSRGIEVDVYERGRIAARFELEPGISVTRVRTPVSTWGDLVFALETRARLAAYDLCCYASPEDGFPFFAGKRAFAMQHGIWWDSPDYGWARRRIVSAVQAIRNLAMCRRTAAVLCVDTNFINYLRMLGPAGHEAARNCVYIPNYADLDEFPEPAERAIRRRFESRRLLFLRRFEPPRGGRFFVDVCQKLCERGVPFEASMVGWGTEEAAIREMVSRSQDLARRVTFEPAGLDAAASIIDQAALSIVPTQWSEGTSLSAIEAIVSGVPVVTTDVGGLGNLILSGFNGEIRPVRPDLFASAIEEALSDWNSYLRMASHCLSLRQQLSRQRWIASVEALLDRAGLLTAPPVHAAATY